MPRYDKKEAYFHEYCKKCKFENVDDVKDPCNECLEQPYNFNSHKPINFKDKVIDY